MKLRFVICVALALPACRDHEIDKLRAVRDAVCACKTVACAEDAMKQLPTKDVTSTPKSQALAREMLDCLAALHAANRPTLDPDAEAAPGDPDR